MSDSAEHWYESGQRSVAREILRIAIGHLGGSTKTDEQWRVERYQVIASLRRICESHGDNDWDDNLHLADVIDKHLARHLDGAKA